MRGNIDRRFARFRRTGDAAALAQLFDAAAPELLRVALYLSGDRHAAEDLVQGTFLIVIEDAASHDAERPVMPWLLGILANRARELRKARGRSLDARRIAEHRAALQPSDPADDVARAEFAAAVTRAIAEMPSPYGEVLTLHLEHGLSAKEIAAALRRPDGTVRTQVVRAMEFLRAALPAGFAIGALVTAAPGRGLAVVREAVLAKIASKQIAVAGTMAAAGTIGGILIMKHVLLAGGAVLLAGVTWTAWSAFSSVADAPSGGETSAPATAASRSVVDSRDATSKRVTEDVVARRAVVSEPTVTTGGLHVEVRWQEDGTPATNVQVSYRTRPNGEPYDTYGSTRSDDRGAATFATLAPGEYRVRACETSEETFVVEADQTTRATLEIRADVVLAGVVVDPTGMPIAGAAVRSVTTADMPTLTTSRGDGSFAWRGAYVSEIWAEKPGRAPSRCQVVQPAVGSTTELRLVLGVEATLFRGIVLDARGNAATDALVAISVDESLVPPQLPDGQRARSVPPVVVRADRNGRFATHSVPAGEHWLAASAKGAGPVVVRVTVADDATEPAVVRLVEGTTLRGVVRDSAGQPVRATVNAWSGSRNSSPGLWPLGLHVIDTHAHATTDDEGRYELPHLLPASHQLHCAAEGMAWVSEVVDLSQAQDFEWNPVLVPVAEIAGRVVDADDRPLAGWQVKGQGDRPGQTFATTDTEGRFTLSNLTSGSYSVWAVPSDATGAAASVHWGEASGVQTGSQNAVLRTGWRTDTAAFLVGRVLGSRGERVMPARIKLYPKKRHGWDHDHETVIDDAEGRFRIGPLPPDEYRIDVSGAGHGWISLRRQLAEQTLDLGTLLLDAHGTVTVTVHRPQECNLEDLVLRLGDEQRSFSDKTFSVREDGTWHSTGWPAGPARLEVWGPGVARVEQAIEVKPSADTRVEVTLERATAVRFVFVQPAPRRASWTEHVKLTLRDPGGVETPHSFQLDGDETYTRTRGLGAGRYTFAATLWQADECQTEGSFVVPGGRSTDAHAPVEVRVAFPDRRPSRATSGPGPLRR